MAPQSLDVSLERWHRHPKKKDPRTSFVIGLLLCPTHASNDHDFHLDRGPTVAVSTGAHFLCDFRDHSLPSHTMRWMLIQILKRFDDSRSLFVGAKIR
jgi:hypothetical protein